MSAGLHMAGTGLSKAKLRLWLKMLKITGGVERELRARMRAEFGSTLPRFDVMSALARFPDGLKMGQISELLRVSNGNVTGIVDRLVEDGLARRIAVEGDRRSNRVRLTVAGRRSFEALADRHEAWLDELLGALTEDEIAAMGAMLDRAAKHLEQRGA
jgi:DNA-binding MarR family transcriptional regulator